MCDTGSNVKTDTVNQGKLKEENTSQSNESTSKKTTMIVGNESKCDRQLLKTERIWNNLEECASEFSDMELDVPDHVADQELFKMFITRQQEASFIDLLLAHKVLDSGVPNRWGCRIPVRSNWNLDEFQRLLGDYEDLELIELLRYGFPISRSDEVGDPTPATCNHLGATRYPQHIDKYIEKEIQLQATMGPFCIPLFIRRIGVSPLSSRPKRDSQDRRVIMDLTFPFGSSVNDGISKTEYCG